jgi:hypothetical protein
MLAIEQTSGRERVNVHGAIELATGQTQMIEVVTVDVVSTIRLLQSTKALCSLGAHPCPARRARSSRIYPILLPASQSDRAVMRASCSDTSRTTNAMPVVPRVTDDSSTELDDLADSVTDNSASSIQGTFGSRHHRDI